MPETAKMRKHVKQKPYDQGRKGRNIQHKCKSMRTDTKLTCRQIEQYVNDGL